jgi:hypothetical protein
MDDIKQVSDIELSKLYNQWQRYYAEKLYKTFLAIKPETNFTMDEIQWEMNRRRDYNRCMNDLEYDE